MTTEPHVMPMESFFAALTTLSRDASGPELVAVRGASVDLPRRTRRDGLWHQHLRGQLICLDNGIAHMRTEQGSWLVPPGRAGWLPPGMRHAILSLGVNSTLHLMVAPRAARFLPVEACVMDITPLARQLLERASSWPWDAAQVASQRRLMLVLLDELRQAPRDPVHLPMPRDRRLLRIAEAIIDQPGTPQTLEQLAGDAGVSPRTAHRLFAAEIGMSFMRWRQQAMLVDAVGRLARGASVGDVADALGYASPSNFIAMFKRHFGTSPARYLRHRMESTPGVTNDVR